MLKQSSTVISKGIDLLGITEIWLTSKETSADLAEMTHQGFSFFQEPRARRRGGGVGLFVSSAHKFPVISLPTQTNVTEWTRFVLALIPLDLVKQIFNDQTSKVQLFTEVITGILYVHDVSSL